MDLHLVAPDSVDDPRLPSGGNVYDRELCRALEAAGVTVVEHLVPGAWPDGDRATLARALATVPDGAAVVLDGLVGSAVPHALEEVRRRLTVLLLVHLPLGLADPRSAPIRAHEQRAVDAAAGVLTTSRWTRDWLLRTYRPEPAHVTVASPGAHLGPLARRGPGSELMCVGALLPAKGQDVLVEALATVRDLRWTCRLVGPLDRDAAFARRVRGSLREHGLEDRVHLCGPVAPAAMTSHYARSDLVVQPTRLETYGMALTEALAHGVPVVASDTGGVAEAVGRTPAVPGALVPPGDPGALARTLRRWLTDPRHRDDLRAAARARRVGLADWSSTARAVLRAVDQAGVNRSPAPTVLQS